MAVARAISIPKNESDVELTLGGRRVKLTNLDKLFWRDAGITKRDLLQYYADVAPALLPHLRDRAMVMKRYPHGAGGEFFFMKRAPSPRPEWIRTCSIAHDSGNVIDFPVIDDLPSLLWVVNLGCIDLNQWYARCDDIDRPDYVHFDLDPGDGAAFAQVRDCALIVRDALEALGMKPLVKTSGSKAAGGVVFANKDLTAITGDFAGSRASMSATVDFSRMEAVMNCLVSRCNQSFYIDVESANRLLPELGGVEEDAANDDQDDDSDDSAGQQRPRFAA